MGGYNVKLFLKTDGSVLKKSCDESDQKSDDGGHRIEIPKENTGTDKNNQKDSYGKQTG